MKGTYRVRLLMYRANLADITIEGKTQTGLVVVTSNPAYEDTISLNVNTYKGALKHGAEILLLISKDYMGRRTRYSIVVPVERFNEFTQSREVRTGEHGKPYWVFNFGEFDPKYTKDIEVVEVFEPKTVSPQHANQNEIKIVALGNGPGILDPLLEELDIDFHPNAKASTIYYSIMEAGNLEYLAFDRKQGKILYRKSD